MHNYRKYYLIFISFFSTLICVGQDKIITIENDTILCRIISINNEIIRYEQSNDGKIIIGKIIPLKNVTTYHQSAQKVKTHIAVEKPWLLNLNLGGGNMPWLLESLDVAAESTNYDELKRGIQFSVSSHYLLNRFMGLGFNYSFFTSGLKGDYLNVLNSTYPTYSYTYQRERHYANFVGPSVLFQQFLSKTKKIFLVETISGGLLFYRGESTSTINLPFTSGASSITQNSLIEGSTLGALLGLSANYSLRPNLTIGAGADFLYGKLKIVDIEYKNSQQDVQSDTDYELPKPLSVSRLNYSIVLRYSF